MATTEQTTLNSETGISREPGSGPSHQDATRPSDAGHVWGQPSAEQTGGVPGGVLMTSPNAKGASLINSDAEPVTNVGQPGWQADMAPDTAKKDMAADAMASDADNTPGPRHYTPEDKAAAKRATNANTSKEG